MNRRNLAWLMALAMLTMLVVVAAPAFPAQDPSETTGEQPEAAADAPSKGSTVENILREQEELLSGQSFSYDPAGRRDPFRSLFESIRANKKGERPRGIAGMLVAEIDLAGIVKDPGGGGDVGLLIGPDNRGYFLRVGDSVFDGRVIAVDSRLGSVTFRQQIDDPRRIKPYRDVVKRLVPLDDEERADD